MPKTEEIDDGEFYIYCPGCKCGHSFNTKPNKPNGLGGFKPVWTFNGDLEKPTFRASLLVTSSWKGVPTVCHSFVTNGKIEFLSDCTHSLAGQTVELRKV